MDGNNVSYGIEYAVKLTNVSVNGLSPITPTLSTILSVTIIITLSSYSLPTTLCTDCNYSKLLLIL